ncbi:MAG: hypothetical protein EOO39_06965 [Cytophagaceae bacterium]|nr:MAG: hypothetical protein EOO39_06965 [Cytophagaceae bacterium]
MAQRPEGYHAYAPQKLNDMIRDELAPAIGFVYHMTIKTGRKTASSLFLEGELNMAEVSRILGHKTVLTTERYYCRTTAQTVINGMKRTGIMNR